MSDTDDDDNDREVDLDDSTRRCPVCYEALARYVNAIQPCGHLFCSSCAIRVDVCPTCRGPIDGRATVFLADVDAAVSEVEEDPLAGLWKRMCDRAGDDATIPARVQELWILTLAPDVVSRAGRRHCHARCPHAREVDRVLEVAAGAGALPFPEWETTVEMLHHSIVSGLHVTDRLETWKYIHPRLRPVWAVRRCLTDRLRSFGEAAGNS